MLALGALLFVVAAAPEEPGFGGAAAPDAEEAPPVDESPGQAELRAQMEAALKRDGVATPTAPAAKAPRRTKLEEDVERAKLDPTLPLLAFRIDVARAELEVEDLTKALVRRELVLEAQARLDALREISDLLERIALARLVRCTRAIGAEIKVKNYRMTAAGPIALTAAEMVAQVPTGDPAGCERITLVEQAIVDKARRLHAARRELKERRFGYHDVAARKALEGEVASLQKELETMAIPGPGVR